MERGLGKAPAKQASKQEALPPSPRSASPPLGLERHQHQEDAGLQSGTITSQRSANDRVTWGLLQHLEPR
jgi:hypothetical protein